MNQTEFRMLNFSKAWAFSILLMSAVSIVSAQNWHDLREQGANYYQIKEAFMKENAEKMKDFAREIRKEANKKAERAGKYEREMEGMVHFMRWSQFIEPRVRESNGDMMAVSEGLYRALNKKSKELQTRNANWSLIGPKSTPLNGGNGRVNAIRVHPTNSNILFACTPASGLWKTIDGGATWTPISDAISALGCTDVAFDPTNPNTMYLATGDGDAADVFTLGVYKSTDGGSTWSPTSLVFNLSSNQTLSKILIHPTNSNTIIVGGRAGIYRSTDAGATWTQTMSAGVRDLEFKTDNPSVVFAGGYGTNVGLWRSADGGVTWTRNTTVPSTAAQRVAVGVSSANPNYVYALVANDGSVSTTAYGLKGVYLSTDGGLNFSLRFSSTNTLGWYTGGTGDKDGQGWYDLAIAVSPTDANTVFTGGVNTWKSTDGGATWTKNTAWDAASTATNYVHADIHDLVFVGSTLYSANDGGVFKTTNAGSSWTDVSANIANAQLYGLGLSASSANTIVSGHQDNGTNLTTNGTSWSQVNGGDGMICFIDRTNNNNVFSSIYNGNLYRSTNGGASFSKIYTVAGGGWVTPWLQDPVTATTQYAGGTNVVKSTNSGTTWTTISSFSGVGTLVSLDVAKTNNQVIVAASGTKVMKTTNGGTSWADITTGLPASVSIQTVHIDVNDANKIYVGLASYTGNSAFVSTNGGTSWTNISAGMASLPVNCFVTQNNAAGVVYCGNDLGVFFSSNSGASWTSYSNGMPGIIVKDLEIFYPTNKLRAATYGRGIWESNLNGVNATPSVSITSPANGAVFGAPATITINANATDSDGSVSNVEFYNGTNLLGSDNTAPYSFTWSGVAVGSYSITAKAYDNAGASSTSAAVAISVSLANDAGISAIGTPNGAINTASFTPSITLRNFGSAALTSVSILYRLDAGTESTFNWTGSLASGATTNVTLPVVTGYSSGNHTFTARTSAPNGGTDGNTANDAITSNFNYSTCANSNEPANNSSTTSTVITVNSTINSQIGSTTDLDYYKFTTTAAAPKVRVTLTNLPADYDLRLYSARNNGTLGSQIGISQNSGTANETIIYNTATTARTYYIRVNGYSGALSTSQCYALTVNTSATNYSRPFEANSSFGKDELEKVSMLVYPNPANEVVNIQFIAQKEGEYRISLIDVVGKEVLTQVSELSEGENTLTMKTDKLAKGLYLIRISNDSQTEIAKLMIEK